VTDAEPTEPTPTDPPDGAGRAFVLIVAGAVALALLAAVLLRPRPAPPSAEIAGDPLLVEGHRLYQQRCISCHGATGKGDGPIAASLQGVSPGNLSDDQWKHGDRPEQVLDVIARGVLGTSMSPWKGEFTDDQIRAVAAYTYHLARRPVPDALRRPDDPATFRPDPEDDNGGT
jgi:mono/diheme cytochrome c family protein